MKMIRIYLTCSILLLIIAACDRKVKETDFPYEQRNSEIFTDSFKLVTKKSITIPLDDSISLYNRSIQYVKFGNKSYLSILNTLSSAVYFYDYHKKKLAYKVNLFKEGPNGVGKLDPLSGHFVIAEDSIAIVNYKQQSMYLVDRKGIVFKKYSLQHGEEPCVNPSSIHKIVKIHDSIYIPCHANEIYELTSTSKSVVILNLKTGNRKYNYILPEIYNKGAWLSPDKYVPVLTNSSSKNQFIIAFPVDPYLYEVNLNGTTLKKHYAGSKFFKRCLPYSSENSVRFIKSISGDDINDYIRSSNHFNNFLSINDGEYFIREVLLSPPLDEIRGSSVTKFNNSYIILNNKFEKVGETLLPSNIYATSISFINDDGLHLANYSLYKKDENNLTFDIFKIEKK